MALTLPFNDPFFGDLERTMRSLTPGGFFGSLGPTMPAPSLAVTQHAFDVRETDNAYELITDAPGMSPDDIKVELRDDLLVVSGEKKFERKEHREKEGVRVHRNERTFTRFSRSFILPDDANQDGINAKVDNGVLTVEIPKVAREQRRNEPKRIRVGGGGGGGAGIGITAAEPAGPETGAGGAGGATTGTTAATAAGQSTAGTARS